GALSLARLFLTIAIERQDMQVIHAGDRARFLLEAFGSAQGRGHISITVGVCAHHLDSYLLPDSRVLRQVNCTHAATAKQLNKGISADGCANQTIHKSASW